MPIRKVYHGTMRALLDLLFPPRDTELLVRTTTPEVLFALVDPVTNENGVAALLPYRDPLVHALVIETKYYGNKVATELLTGVLSEYLLESLSEETALEKRMVVLVPLPLSGKRRRERGYNQVEQVLGRTATGLGARMETNILSRSRHTQPQTRLSREKRRENVSGAFTAVIPDPAYLYIVVDDVRTTGATLREALGALRQAGATHAIGLALAY